MKDPTRIPEVMRVLQRAWEAQPELSFAELFARLEPLGVARNSSDEELVAALKAELELHPWSFEPGRDGAAGEAGTGDAVAGRAAAGEATEAAADADTRLARVELAGSANAPERIATIGRGWIAVRPAGAARRVGREAASLRGTQRGARRAPERSGHKSQVSGGGTGEGGTRPLMQPVMWRYEAVLRCRPGEPLRVRSAQGSEHRLGVVRRITVLGTGELASEKPATDGLSSLSGLRAAAMFSGGPGAAGLTSDGAVSAEYLLSFETGATVLVGSRLWLTRVARREVEHEFLRWERLERAELGEPLAYRVPQGEAPGAERTRELTELGAITRILPI